MSRGDLFARSCESRRLVEWGSVSSVLSISGGGLLSSLFGGLLLRCVCTIIEWMVFKFCLTSLSVRRASVSLFIVQSLLLKIIFFISLGGGGCSVSLCSGWSGSVAFCRSCEPRSRRCSFSGSMFASSCKWLLLVSAVHPVAILSAWFCFVCRCVS